ncbi:MAG: DUF2062 domain-containing protein, partial [Rhodospirillaceae bacterium]
LLRGSIIASAIGTVVGNPWTFPFIWVGTYEVGKLMLGGNGEVEGSRPFLRMFGGLYRSISTFDGDLFALEVLPTFLPMFVGSLPVALIVGIASYFVLLKPIRAFHHLRQERKARRQQNYLSTEGGR